MKSRLLVGVVSVAACFAIAVSAQNNDSQLKAVQIPNDVSYWKNAGFAEMVPPTRLPTDKSIDNLIRVWVKVPTDRKVTVEWLADQKRFSLKFPPGTIADRVETMMNAPHAMQVINGIEDVRGARIGEHGETYFHVYEPVPGEAQRFLRGYEWLRTDAKGDDVAADSLIGLYYQNAGDSAQSEIRQFRRLNQCGGCHVTDAPAPSVTQSRPSFLSDSHGFFQPMTVLDDSMVIRSHRKWDLNADDPFVTVSCGTQPVRATTNGGSRGYACPGNAVPVGKLQLKLALEKKDPHALQVCESRKYLFEHMDQKARAAYQQAFQECSLR